jgi:hypothetical protein
MRHATETVVHPVCERPADQRLRDDGYEDGARGYPPERIGSHRKACAKHSVTPDLQAYQAGRAEGLQEFCQPHKGFQLGSRGGNYAGVCPAELEPDFVEAYRVGRVLYGMESSVRSAASQISTKERRLDQIPKEILESEATLVQNGIAVEQRVLLLAEIKELAEEAGRLDQEIKALIADKARREDQLADYRASLDTYY